MNYGNLSKNMTSCSIIIHNKLEFMGIIMNSTQQLLRDSAITPSAEIIADGLGAANNTYINFIEGLKKHDISLMDWRYYNDGKAWLSKGEYKWTTARGTSKVKPIFWISIWKGFFRVSFFFLTDDRDKLLLLSISQETRRAIRNAKAIGKTMKYIPIVFDIGNEEQLDDLFELAQMKKQDT